MQLSQTASLSDSGHIFTLAEEFAESAAISTEAATALLLWLGSVMMIQNTTVQWQTGIWQPAGLTMSIVEGDDTNVESVVNHFINIVKQIGVDPIHDTVKEGPAGLIARLESANNYRHEAEGQIDADSLEALAAVDTSALEVKQLENHGNARALIYPSGRAFLSYMYDTPFFNALDELIQHGHLNVRGKTSNHRLDRVNMSTLTTFHQGSLVTLTNDPRVQNNMFGLMRQMLIFWPTSGTRRHKKEKRIDIALHKIRQIAGEGNLVLKALGEGKLHMPSLSDSVGDSYVSAGAGVRYTVLNRENRIMRIAIGVAFWRIATGGQFEITAGDLAVADSILHLHEMGGRLFELAMSKGRTGHEFTRLFVQLLNGESISDVVGPDVSQASDSNTGMTAAGKLRDMSVLDDQFSLMPEYSFVSGRTMGLHRQRWGL